MSHHTRHLLTVILAIFTLIYSASAAMAIEPPPPSADPNNAVIGQPPPPPPTITDSVPGCDVFAVGNYTTRLFSPQRVNEGTGPGINRPLRGDGIYGEGYIDVFGNTSCSQAKVRFAVETKVCNRWGFACRWDQLRAGEVRQLPVQGRIEEHLTADCRDGADTYKVTATVTHVEMGFEQTPVGKRWFPTLETKSKSFQSDEVPLDCQ